MSQHDFNIANQGFPAFRADLNAALVALAENSSGNTAPATTRANMFWADTAAGLLKMFDTAGSTWITVGTLDAANLGLQKNVITTRGDLVVGNAAAAAARLALGAADSFVVSDGTDITFIAPASQVEQEAGTLTTKPVTPGRQQFHPSAAKMWCNFDGTGTPSINGSYNVAGIVDNGNGDHTLTIAADFSGSSYVTVVSMTNSSSLIEGNTVGSHPAGSVTIRTWEAASSSDTTKTFIDRNAIFVACYGDQ